MRIISSQETAQVRKVRDAYAKTGDCNPEYRREFDVLSDMRMKEMAANYRYHRGLPPDGKTPYDR
jgi:hypothetical protein